MATKTKKEGSKRSKKERKEKKDKIVKSAVKKKPLKKTTQHMIEKVEEEIKETKIPKSGGKTELILKMAEEGNNRKQIKEIPLKTTGKFVLTMECSSF